MNANTLIVTNCDCIAGNLAVRHRQTGGWWTRKLPSSGSNPNGWNGKIYKCRCGVTRDQPNKYVYSYIYLAFKERDFQVVRFHRQPLHGFIVQTGRGQQ